MEGIHMLKDMLRKGHFMVKIDLKDAYFTVPVWQNHRKFLRLVIVIVIVIVIVLGQFCPSGKVAMRLTLCEAPTHETRPDHNTGNDVPYSFQ